jgi:glyoxylase I family protein
MSRRVPNLGIQSLHHIAIICADYEKSKWFYTEILGFQIKNEVFREERQSYKLDLQLNGQYLIELFSFPNPPQRLSRPESTGLRHFAFGVQNIEEAVLFLANNQIETEDIRIDEHTGRKFTFFADPDDLPIELYEIEADQ